MLKLDTDDRIELSIVDLPPGHEEHGVVLVDQTPEEDTIGMFTWNTNKCEFLNCYSYNCTRNGSNKIVHEWQMKNALPLPIAQLDDVRIRSGPQGYIFIQGDTGPHPGNTLQFTLLMSRLGSLR